MIKSMQSGIAGMNAYQQALSVTSNNISNASTVGFKGQKAMFTDLLYTNTMGGSAGGGFAATNPMSVGNGSKIGSIQTNFQAGQTQAAGPMDAALTGDGFFVVGDNSGGSVAYTRNGNFGISSDGRIVNANGQYVLGFMAGPDGSIVSNPTPMPIEIPIGKAVPGVPSTEASLSGNLNFSDKDSATKQIEVVNGEGQRVTLTVVFNKDGSASVSVPGVANPVNGTFGSGATSVPLGALGLTGLSLDLSDITMLDTSENIIPRADGSVAKTAVGYSIGDNGNVILSYSDGSVESVAQLAVATFPNNSGMMQQGDGTYTPGLSAGQVSMGVAGENGAGGVRGGFLESSNVDLANEFVDLMIYQKGFQGSTKIIKISDDILNEVVNLIR